MRYANLWLYENIKTLREQARLTQSELARRLNVSRVSVNAWETGLSVPSAQNIVELAQIFRVSTDTILGIEREYTLDISDLTPEQRKLISELVQHFYTENNKDG